MALSPFFPLFALCLAWLGDKDQKPDFQPPDFEPHKDTPVSILKNRIPCNWAQIMEG